MDQRPEGLGQGASGHELPVFLTRFRSEALPYFGISDGGEGEARLFAGSGSTTDHFRHIPSRPTSYNTSWLGKLRDGPELLPVNRNSELFCA